MAEFRCYQHRKQKNYKGIIKNDLNGLKSSINFKRIIVSLGSGECVLSVPFSPSPLPSVSRLLVDIQHCLSSFNRLHSVGPGKIQQESDWSIQTGI